MEKKAAINSVQKTLITEFMRNHPNLQTGKFNKDFTFKTGQRLWEEIMVTLNSVPNGAKKDWRQWRKTWQDLKKNAKSKAASVKKYTQTTGGGEPVILSKIDSEIIDLIDPSQVHGLPVKETTLKFDFDQNHEENICAYGEVSENDTDVPMEGNNIEFIFEEEIPENSAITGTKNQDASSSNFNLLFDGDEANYCSTQEIPKESLTPLLDDQMSPVKDQQDSSKSNNYAKTPKKMNKTTRLTKSLDISNNLVNSINERNKILNNYYDEKINYLKKDIELKEKTFTVLENIKDILENAYP